MDQSNNCLEILLNLLYLARHRSSDAAAVAAYLAEAEIQALRLAAIYSGYDADRSPQVEVAGQNWKTNFDKE